MSAFGEWSSIIAAVVASVVVGATRAGFSTLIQDRLKKKALAAADTDDFDDVLATGDLKGLGAILRDRLGSVPLETLLNDADTQSQVYRSLQRLTEVVNQPAPDQIEPTQESPDTEDGTSRSSSAATASPPSRSENYIDWLDDPVRAHIAGEIGRITHDARAEIRKSDIWTGLARARRSMEKEMLPLLGISRRALSPRIFHNARFRGAMGSFLGVANKAIHGEEVSFEDAERALRAAEFIALNLADPQFADSSPPTEGPSF